ncbi:MAG: single-stranded DNA-binding protein [Candidatus Competibacteraceae bacterium]|nr:single-stranded DNA-binding protein [Candidatus Competibacteraceae bacterium]
MIRTLCTGTLYGDPQSRTSQNGKPFTTARLRADDGKGGSVWLSLIGFGSEADALARLKDQSAVAISGKATLKTWTDKQGTPQAGLDVVIDQIITLRAKPKAQRTEPFSRSARPVATAAAPFNDALDF